MANASASPTPYIEHSNRHQGIAFLIMAAIFAIGPLVQ